MGVEQFADEIDTVMRELGIDRDEAAIVVALRHGDLVGDVLIVGSLSEEEKRRRRRTLREVMVELGELEDESQAPDRVTSSEPNGQRRRQAS